ncbi:MAG: hypothetical protein Q4Q17_05920, partial [Tissierellia bacterium]|nr:hypothetical protein [Tissierellia bacterium]
MHEKDIIVVDPKKPVIRPDDSYREIIFKAAPKGYLESGTFPGKHQELKIYISKNITNWTQLKDFVPKSKTDDKLYVALQHETFAVNGQPYTEACFTNHPTITDGDQVYTTVVAKKWSNIVNETITSNADYVTEQFLIFNAPLAGWNEGEGYVLPGDAELKFVDVDEVDCNFKKEMIFWKGTTIQEFLDNHVKPNLQDKIQWQGTNYQLPNTRYEAIGVSFTVNAITYFDGNFGQIYEDINDYTISHTLGIAVKQIAPRIVVSSIRNPNSYIIQKISRLHGLYRNEQPLENPFETLPKLIVMLTDAGGTIRETSFLTCKRKAKDGFESFTVDATDLSSPDEIGAYFGMDYDVTNSELLQFLKDNFEIKSNSDHIEWDGNFYKSPINSAPWKPLNPSERIENTKDQIDFSTFSPGIRVKRFMIKDPENDYTDGKIPYGYNKRLVVKPGEGQFLKDTGTEEKEVKELYVYYHTKDDRNEDLKYLEFQDELASNGYRLSYNEENMTFIEYSFEGLDLESYITPDMNNIPTKGSDTPPLFARFKVDLVTVKITGEHLKSLQLKDGNQNAPYTLDVPKGTTFGQLLDQLGID